MVDVGELRAQFTLLYQQVDKALKHIESTTRRTGKTIEQNLGKKPTSALKSVGRTFEDALGAKPQTAIQETRKQFTKLVWTAESGTKAISRVVTGILISQTFYRLVRIIQQATSEMWKFMVSMEQSYLALELLLGSVRGAEVFLRRLETFAALTPFEMGDVITGTRRLMGFGFAASEVLPILEAVADACAIIGVSPQALDDLMRAIGKIKATGRMTAREIRSFGAAGIPIFGILMEELELTRDQIRNIGREAAGQANVVIPAILRGLEARFGGAAERLARTVGGLLSTLKDDLQLIAKDVFAGLYETFRGFLGRLVDRLEELRDIIIKYGVGGLFEAIVPKRYQTAVRTVVASLLSIGRALMGIHKALQPVREAFQEVFIRMLSIVIPLLNVLATMIEKFTRWVFQSDAVMKKWAISIMAAYVAMNALLIVNAVTASVRKLAWALGLTAAATSKWTIAITILIVALTFLLLQIPKVKAWIDNAFNSIARFLGLDIAGILQPLKEIEEDLPSEDAFHQVAEGVAEVAEETKKAEKELGKFLLAFDEVYAIPEKAEKMPEIEMPELEEEFPVEEWWGDLEDKVEETLEDVGEEFDSFISNIWKMLKDLFKAWWNMLKDTFLAHLQLLKDLAAAIGNYIRDVWRAFLQLFKDLWGALREFAKESWGAFAQLFKDLWQALVTFVKGIWGAFSQLFKDLWNAVKEFVLGIWGALTQLVKDLWNALTTFVRGFWEAIRQLWRDLLSAESFRDAIAAFRTFFATVWELFGQWFGAVGEAFRNFFTTVWELFGQWFGATREAFVKFFTTVYDAFVVFGKSLIAAYSNFFLSIYNATVRWVKAIGEAFYNFFIRIGEATIKFGESVKAAFVKFFLAMYDAFVKLGESIITILNLSESTVAKFANVFLRVLRPIMAFIKKVKEAFLNACRSMAEGFTRVVTSIRAGIVAVLRFFGNLASTIRSKFIAVVASIKSTIISVVNAVANAINKLIQLINRIPGVKIPTIPTIAAQGEARGMQRGGILRKEQLVKAGEVPEAVTPLTPEALKPWAEAIANALRGVDVGAPAAGAGYVAVPIDSKGELDLERRLFVIRKREIVRGSV